MGFQVFAIFGDDLEEVDDGPLVVDAAGAGLGGELGEEVGEGEGVGGAAVGGEAALDGVGDGGGVGGDGGGEAAGEDAGGVAEGVAEVGGVRVWLVGGVFAVGGEEAEDQFLHQIWELLLVFFVLHCC